MNIGNILYWSVDISVGDKVVRGNSGGIDSDIDSEYRSGNGGVFG